MTKERKYNLLNKEYLYGISALFNQFYKKNIPAVLVGGTAVQSKIASITSKGKSLDEVQELEKLLRKTDDIDIATLASDQQIFDVLNSIDTDEKIIGNNLYKLSFERKGLKRPVIVVERAGEDYAEAFIRLNIENNEHDLERIDRKHYKKIVESGEEINLKNDGLNLKFNIAKPEYLIAAKLMRFAERDRKDIYNLVKILQKNSIPINWYKLRIIGHHNKDKFSQLRSLLNQDEENYKTE